MIPTLMLLTVVSMSEPTYTKDAKPIFEKRCSNCHNENFSGNNWLEYDQAYAKRDKIKTRIQNKTMPMGEDMPQKERNTLIKWVDAGAKK